MNMKVELSTELSESDGISELEIYREESVRKYLLYVLVWL